MGLGERLQHAWNAFRDNSLETFPAMANTGPGYTYRPDRPSFRPGTERSILTAVLNRIAIDVSAVNIRHTRVDENGNFLDVIDDSLNQCLTVEANIDQTGRDLIQDIVMSLCDEGCVAVVPVETDINPVKGTFKIRQLRTGKIMQWYPDKVRIYAYNEKKGIKEEFTMRKRDVAIIENPLYAVMNEPSSTFRRLIHKLNLLDLIDEQSSAGKMDLIIQLPYVIKSEQRRQEAEKRRKDIEVQLMGSKYGIAYTDGTERITQLNRPVENNLLTQIQTLTQMFYGQLGITEGVLNGTASEAEQLNYYNRTIEPICSAIANEMKRKFLTPTARTQGQSITFYRDPFKLAPVNEIAEIADKFTRNEILTSNEIRGLIGFKPSTDPKADQLINSNIAQPYADPNAAAAPTDEEAMPEDGGESDYVYEDEPAYVSPFS